MEYYVLYDLNDNLVCYLNDIYDLSSYTGLRLYDINYKFKKTNKKFILINRNKQRLKVYKFI